MLFLCILNTQGCPFDDPGHSSLGPNYETPNVEYQYNDPNRAGVGFGHGMSLNSGSGGVAENYMQVFVRNTP